jgi:hypothetical protein
LLRFGEGCFIGCGQGLIIDGGVRDAKELHVFAPYGATLNSTPWASGSSVPQLMVQVWRRM